MDSRDLRWRRRDWAALPHLARRDIVPFLDVKDCMSLNYAMTNHEARPHLIESYRGMRSAAFDRLVYTDKEDSKSGHTAFDITTNEGHHEIALSLEQAAQ